MGQNEDGVMKRGPEKPVGLNLVTDFSVQAGMRARDQAPAPTFVDLNDLKMLSKERERERTAQRFKDVFRKRTFQGFNRLPEVPAGGDGGISYLDPREKVSPSKKGRDELSPSDRPIMIGYTVPYAGSATPQKERSKELDSAEANPTPVTPSIIVTPAREQDPFWSGDSPDYRRPRSSVYSQPTPQVGHVVSGSDIPPVPAIPALHSVARVGGVNSDSKRQSSFSTRNRSLSTGTVFEEDTSPRIGRRSRSYSDEQLNPTTPRRQSATSFVNKHHSQGWWTYLLSPLLGQSKKSPTTTPTSAERHRPHSVRTTSTATEWWEEKEVSCFSPDTPETAAAGTNRGFVGFDFGIGDNNPGKDSCDINSEYPVEYGVASCMFPGGPVQGAAAEYYQACAHELFSGRPYFECVNHVCSITPKDKIPAAGAGAETGPHGDRGMAFLEVDAGRDDAGAQETGNRGMDLLGPDTAGKPDAAQPTNGNKGLALIDVDEPNESKNPFIEPSKPQRQYSGSTAVDDGSYNPFEPAKEINSVNETTEEGPKLAPKATSPPFKDKELPLAPEPAHLYPPEKQASSYYQTTTVGPPATHVHFPPNPCPPQPSAAPTERQIPRPITVFPGAHAPVQSPDTPSPAFQQTTERGGIPLSRIHDGPAPAYGSNENSYPYFPQHPGAYPVSRTEIVHPIAERERIETHRQRLEREDAIGKKVGGLWRGRGPVSKKGCFGRPGREGRLRRRWYVAISAFFLIIIILAIVLATTLTRKGDETPVQSRWLNLTGYPPMPTGIATIAGPELQEENSGCVGQTSLWSCALPKEQHDANKPYAANQPNFRVAIRFQNGTYENSTTVESGSRLLRLRDNGLFEPSPKPPSIADQTFLGNTTDMNSEPFAGEKTPFYISFLSPMKLSSHEINLTRRSNDASPFPNISSIIPQPDESPDGSPAPATLYPNPESQPVRLYNRGQNDEHYGFYTYFDKSIFLTSSGPLDGTSDKNPEDKNGGSKIEESRVRCTWAQTRFLVQIWTRPDRAGMALIQDSPNSTTTTTTASGTPTPSPSSSSPSSNSSATDFTRPGSFPYPVTITIDRHGGSAKQKMLYCYGLDDGHFNTTERKLQIEDRGAGGTLVNPPPGIFNNTDQGGESLVGRDSDSGSDAQNGGIDGGTGGCSCRWANWVKQI